jgi:integrase
MPILLVDDVRDYVAFASIERVTEGQYFRSVKCFSEHLERPATRDDLREPLVNAWLSSLAKRLSAFTVLGRKRGLTPVWNWLAGFGYVPWYNARALRRTKAAYPPVAAWSASEVAILLEAAAGLQGRLKTGVYASDFMKAYVSVAYETGFRPSDMRLLRWNDLRDGRMIITQHKTQKSHAVMFSPSTMEALEPLRTAESETIFMLTKGGIRRWELALFRRASILGFRRRHGQACGTLRKTHGTEVCRVEGLPAAAQSLGHVDGIRVARQSYCQADAINAVKPPTALINALTRAHQDKASNRSRT